MKKSNYTPEEIIFKLEKKLLQAEVRHSADELDRLLADEFIEYGSSGQVYDKLRVVRALGEESGVEIEISNFRGHQLAPGIMLVTYRSVTRNAQDRTAKHALRSSIWKLEAGAWRMVFHQGTPAGAPQT